MNINHDRLNAIINHLWHIHATEPERFNLDSWICSDTEENLTEAISTWQHRHAARQPLNCNTAACFAGHLPLVFPDVFFWEKAFGALTAHRGVVSCTPEFRDGDHTTVNEHALAKFFGGTPEQWARVIFSTYYPEKYPQITIPMVIARIKSVFNLPK